VKELIFTDEWNANLALPTMVKGRVHVLHAHLRELESGSIFPTCRTFEAAEKLVNKTYRPRIIWPSYGVFAIPPTRRELLELTGCMVRDAGRRLLRVTGLRRG
jgi:hypothetical protein